MKHLINQSYKRIKSSAVTDKVVESKWFAFKSLMFLKNKNKSRLKTEARIEANCPISDKLCFETFKLKSMFQTMIGITGG